MTRISFCNMVDRQDGKKYLAKLNVVLKPVRVDEEPAPVGDIPQKEDLAPDQRIPDGNYTRLPYQFDRHEAKVRVVSGRMFGGWL